MRTVYYLIIPDIIIISNIIILEGVEKMRNQDIHKAFKESGVRKWRVAELLNVTDVAFSKKLRKELPQEEKEKIFQAIEKVKEQAKEVD